MVIWDDGRKSRSYACNDLEKTNDKRKETEKSQHKKQNANRAEL